MGLMMRIAGDRRGGAALRFCVILAMVAVPWIGPRNIKRGFDHARYQWEQIWSMPAV